MNKLLEAFYFLIGWNDTSRSALLLGVKFVFAGMVFIVLLACIMMITILFSEWYVKP